MVIQSENLFDRLPDETITRIFTLGREDLRSILGRTSVLLTSPRRLPYSFTTCVRTLCRRFRSITLDRGNAHLFYVTAHIWFHPSEDLSVLTTNFYRTLDISDGCEIHLFIFLDASFGNSQMAWRLTLHAMEAVRKYSSQLVDIYIDSPATQPASVTWWVWRWLEGLCISQRLALIRMKLEACAQDDDGSQFENAELHSYCHDVSTSALQLSVPSLLEIEFSGLPITCTPVIINTHCLNTVILPPNPSSSSSQPDHNWPIVKGLLAGCPTLCRLEITLSSGRPSDSSIIESASYVTSHLSEMLVILDPPILSALFRMFSFPSLLKATVIVVPESYEERRDYLLPDNVPLPSLSQFRYLDSTHAGIPFLDLCKIPLLKDFTIKTVRNWTNRGTLQRLRSPASLRVGLGLSLSTTEQLRTLDLSETEVLRFIVGVKELKVILDQVDTRPTCDRIALPNLKLLSVRDSNSLLDTIHWLLTSFQLPPSFWLLSEGILSLKAEITLRHGTGFPSAVLVTSLVVSSKRSSGHFRSFELVGEENVRAELVYLRGAPLFLETPWIDLQQLAPHSPQELFHVSFSRLECFDVTGIFAKRYLIAWLDILRDFTHGTPPLPHLQILKLGPDSLQFTEYMALIKWVFEMKEHRLWGGVPLNRVEIRVEAIDRVVKPFVAVFREGGMSLEESLVASST